MQDMVESGTITKDTFFQRAADYAKLIGYAKDGWPILNVAEPADHRAWLHWMCYFADLKMQASFNLMARMWQDRHGKMTVPSRMPEDFDAMRTIEDGHVRALRDRLDGIGTSGALFPEGPWRREFAKRLTRFDIAGGRELIDEFKAGAAEPTVKQYPAGWVGLQPPRAQPAGRFVSETDAEWIRKRNAARAAEREQRAEADAAAIDREAVAALEAQERARGARKSAAE